MSDDHPGFGHPPCSVVLDGFGVFEFMFVQPRSCCAKTCVVLRARNDEQAMSERRVSSDRATNDRRAMI